MHHGVQITDELPEQVAQFFLHALFTFSIALDDLLVVPVSLLKFASHHTPAPFSGGLAGAMAAVPGQSHTQTNLAGLRLLLLKGQAPEFRAGLPLEGQLQQGVQINPEPGSGAIAQNGDPQIPAL